MSLPEAETQVIKVELRHDIFVNFALVVLFLWKCVTLCHCAIAQSKIAGSFPLLPVQIYPQTFTH